MIIIYPWMPKELNPNARVHWATKSKMFKKYKEACWGLTMASHLPRVKGDRIHLEITFYKPNKMRRDLDNCLAAFKAGLDAISLATGVDDSQFLLSIDMADQIGGYVKVNFNYKGINK